MNTTPSFSKSTAYDDYRACFVGTVSWVYSKLKTVSTACFRAARGSICSRNTAAPLQVISSQTLPFQFVSSRMCQIFNPKIEFGNKPGCFRRGCSGGHRCVALRLCGSEQEDCINIIDHDMDGVVHKNSLDQQIYTWTVSREVPWYTWAC